MSIVNSGNTPEIIPEWLLVTVLANTVDHATFLTGRTETLLGWGFGVQINLQMSEGDIKYLQDDVVLTNSKKSEVMCARHGAIFRKTA